MALFKITRNGVKSPVQEKAKSIRWVDKMGDGEELVGMVGNNWVLFAIDKRNNGYSVREIYRGSVNFHFEKKPLKTIGQAKAHCTRLLKRQILTLVTELDAIADIKEIK